MKQHLFLPVLAFLFSAPILALDPNPASEALSENLTVDVKAASSRDFGIVKVLNYSNLPLRFLYNDKKQMPDSEGAYI